MECRDTGGLREAAAAVVTDGMEAGGSRRGLGNAPPPRRRSRFFEASRRESQSGASSGPRRHHPTGTFAKGAQKQTALGFQQICKTQCFSHRLLPARYPPPKFSSQQLQSNFLGVQLHHFLCHFPGQIH